MSLSAKKEFLINTAFFSVIVIIIYLFFKYALTVLMPFMIGILFAVLLHGPINWLTKKTRISSKFFSLIFILLLLTVLGILAWILFCILAKQVSNLLYALPNLINNWIPELTSRILEQTSYLINSLPGDSAQMIYQALPPLVADIQNGLINLAKTSGSHFAVFTATSLPQGFVMTFMTIVSCTLISMDYPRIRDSLKRQFSDKAQLTLIRIKKYCIETLINMCKVYLILMVITFALLFIFLTLWEVKNPVAIAAVISVVDILPILGIGIILIPWAIISLLTGNWLLAVKLLISYLVITVLRSFIEPKLLGTRIGLHPVISLLAIYTGLQVGGVSGMFGLVFLAIIIKRLNDSGSIHIWKSPGIDPAPPFKR